MKRYSIIKEKERMPFAVTCMAIEIWVQSLGWEDPLEKGTATHSGILAWRIPWTI